MLLSIRDQLKVAGPFCIQHGLRCLIIVSEHLFTFSTGASIQPSRPIHSLGSPALATTLLTWREIPYLRQHAGASAGFGLGQTVRELVEAVRNPQFRLIFIIANTLIIIFADQFEIARVLPIVLVGAAFSLFVTVYQTQKMLWKIDMENKRDAEK